MTMIDFRPNTQNQLNLLEAMARAGYIAKGTANADIEGKVAAYVARFASEDFTTVSAELTRAQGAGLAPVWQAVLGALPVEAPAVTVDLSSLPEGRYAVPGGDTRLKVRITRSKDGYTYATDAAVYGKGKTYGRQGLSTPYRGALVPELKAIVADPHAALAAYGHLTSKCGICNRPLEDAESVARGIGPVCASRL